MKRKHLLTIGIGSAFVVTLLTLQASETSLTASVFNGEGLHRGVERAGELLEGTGIRIDSSLIDAIASALNFVLNFAGIFAFVAFVVAGFIFILGLGSEQSITRAKKIMIYAAIGLLVIIFAFVFTQFIANVGTAQTP